MVSKSKPKPKPSDVERFKRFLEMARDKAFQKVAQAPKSGKAKPPHK